MKNLVSCKFNMDTGYVKLRYSDSSMISMNCTTVEDKVANRCFRRTEPDWLLYNDPLSYTDRIFPKKTRSQQYGHICQESGLNKAL